MTERERKNRKTVKRAFYNYATNRAKYLEAQDDVISAGLTACADGDRVVGGESGGLCAKVAKLVDSAEYRWCRVVEQTIAAMAESGKDKFIEDKFFRRKGEWYLCDKYSISFRSLENWTREIITYGEKIAIEMQLITLIER